MMQSMARHVRSVSLLAVSGALGAGLAGCGLSSLTSGLGTGVFGGSGGQSQVQAVTEEQLLSAAKADVTGATGTTVAGTVSAGCPRFDTWPGEGNVTIYEPGQVGNGVAIMHRGEITKTARECIIEQGRVTIKYGFSGRVLMGPRGVPGRVSLPVRIFVTDAKRERVATDTLQVETDMVVENPIGYFSAVRIITFDVAEGARPGEYEMFVAFERNVPGAG